ncbi:hypothetical protein BIY24_02135 [Halobacteriovorax marinus]|uniref:hypothetical protein n=1 Tax=Halobacteriovorax marinus TaxID=97084 RepID=UPI000BC33966|nr:hypothetical protein [Halobacteriovorax marinus]ATH06780.1 hypothetical protein BIY24_02135 [Halobacteriovorax marinus]
MRIFTITFLFIFLVSCSNGDSPLISSNAKDDLRDSDPITSVQSFSVTGDYNGNLWKSEWTSHVYEALIDQNSALLDNEISTYDLSLINCENYNTFSRENKMKFWALFMASFSHYESSYNPNERYWESSLGKYSEGLFQLSTTDSNYYTFCNVDSSNILNPKENIQCAVAILDVQIDGSTRRESGRLFPNSYFYWSVLTRSSSKSKVINYFKNRVKQKLPACS